MLAVLLLPGLVVEISFSWAGPTDLPFAAGFVMVQLGCATAGGIVSSRLPGNAVGWIFQSIGILLGLMFAADAYARLGINTGFGPLAGDDLAAWVGSWIFIPAAFGLPMFLFLLFPTGRFLSERWKLAGGTLGLTVVIAAASKAFKPGRISPGIENPLAPGGALGEMFLLLDTVTDLLALPAFLLAVAGLVVRLWRSRGAERQQLKWFTYVSAFVGVGFACGILIPTGVAADLVFLVGLVSLAGLPVAASIAILRHRLYDIDVVINRTLVYGVLTVCLALVYFGSVVSLQYVFRALTGGGSQLVILASTLAIAALFSPLRRRIQTSIDRLFYRKKYDAGRVLAVFGARLKDKVDLDSLSGELETVVRETLQPAHVSMWLREPDRKVKR